MTFAPFAPCPCRPPVLEGFLLCGPRFTHGIRALLIVNLKTIALRSGDEHYNRAARFWAKIFGINFALGVVASIPLKFQFGTHWAERLPCRTCPSVHIHSGTLVLP